MKTNQNGYKYLLIRFCFHLFHLTMRSPVNLMLSNFRYSFLVCFLWQENAFFF